MAKATVAEIRAAILKELTGDAGVVAKIAFRQLRLPEAVQKIGAVA